MNRWQVSYVGVACLAGLLAATGRWSPAAEDGLAAAVAEIARLRGPSYEDTCKARNDRLAPLFGDYVAQHGGRVTADVVRQFHTLLRRHGLTSFDDFLAAETTPLRFRTDSATGDQVPVFGPLGSDVINPWLAALEVTPGKPLDEQPIYRLAGNALRDHIDFALIGTCDPNLSLDLLPPKLRENAAAAYRRLNPTNRFDGGFDHPLFYATVREAAKKLFRQDYPNLRVTMADLVTPEAAGGFGVRSCLLCHNRDYNGVYGRLLGQGLYLQSKAADLPAASPAARETRATADVFLRSAEIVRSSFPDKVDVEAARRSLNALSPDNLGRLRPGYPDFCAKLEKLGCLGCHSKQARITPDKDPREYGAYVLDLNDYFQTDNIKSLLTLVDLEQPARSKLLLKATAKLTHAGAEDVKLRGAQAEELHTALLAWVYAFTPKGKKPHQGAQ